MVSNFAKTVLLFGVALTLQSATANDECGSNTTCIAAIWFQGWTAEDYYVASVVNNTVAGGISGLRGCGNDSNCRTNEKCLLPNQCGRGVCSCLPPNYVEGSDCMLPTTSTSTTSTTSTTTTSTSTTTTSTTTTTTTPSTTTTTTTTTATTPTTSTTTTSTTTTLPEMYYYSICDHNNDCARVGLGKAGAVFPNGLICKNNGTGSTKYCLCTMENFMWVPSSYQCRLRDYGDPCVYDTDCNNALYVKTSAGGHKCLPDGTCGCATGFTAVTGTKLMAGWGLATVPAYVQGPEINRTYCVITSDLTNNVASGGDCTLNVLERSDTTSMICADGLVCLGCPLDIRDAHQVGTCARFTYPEPPRPTTAAPNDVTTPSPSNSTNSGSEGATQAPNAAKSVESLAKLVIVNTAVVGLFFL